MKKPFHYLVESFSAFRTINQSHFSFQPSIKHINGYPLKHLILHFFLPSNFLTKIHFSFQPLSTEPTIDFVMIFVFFTVWHFSFKPLFHPVSNTKNVFKDVKITDSTDNYSFPVSLRSFTFASWTFHFSFQPSLTNQTFFIVFFVVG